MTDVPPRMPITVQLSVSTSQLQLLYDVERTESGLPTEPLSKEMYEDIRHIIRVEIEDREAEIVDMNDAVIQYVDNQREPEFNRHG